MHLVTAGMSSAISRNHKGVLQPVLFPHISLIITSKNQKISVNVVALMNRFSTSSVKFRTDNRGFLKIDHSDIDARIVLEQNKFSKKSYL